MLGYLHEHGHKIDHIGKKVTQNRYPRKQLFHIR
jgi:hypothetical protein